MKALFVLCAMPLLLLSGCTKEPVRNATNERLPEFPPGDVKRFPLDPGFFTSFASITIDCGDKTITVSTGGNKGRCQAYSDSRRAVCHADDGSGGTGRCSEGCVESSGSGSCEEKRKGQ